MSNWSFANVFICALKLSNRIKRAHCGFPIPIDTLVDHVKEHLKVHSSKSVPIHFHPRNYEASAFIGTVEISDKRVDIYYDLNRNLCWKRFIITKELCHILYDTPNSQHRSSTPEQIESLLTQILAGLSEVEYDNDNQPVSCEKATILMAIEILLPDRERENVEKMIRAGANARSVAEKYRLPEQMVSFYLDKSYINFMTALSKQFKASELE